MTSPLEPPDISDRDSGMVGMWMFLAALFMLFASSLLGYVVIRTGGVHAQSHVHLPAGLWLSTALVIGVSIVIARAQMLIRQGYHRPSRNALIIALALAAAFVTVQTPALALLLIAHRSATAGGNHIYGLVFFLIFLHGLHVLGGIIALAHLTIGSSAVTPLRVRRLAAYWHFLDAVWIAMFGVLFFLA